MYQKVETNVNFVEHEKATEKFWRENNIFQKSMDSRRKGLPILFMTDRLLPTESPISATC